MELDTSMINKGYIGWLLITLVLMAVSQIFLLNINFPRMEDIELRSQFQNDSYKQNLTTTSNKSIGYARYHGEEIMFTLETYYTIMSKDFNLLEQAGVAQTLIEEQRVVKFEAGLHDEKAISYIINAKSG